MRTMAHADAFACDAAPSTVDEGRAMAAAVRATPRDVFVSWLPRYHDMGLIGAWLGSLLVGFPLVVMSPLAFLARPRRWLETITRHGGTLSAGPNFAYELVLERLADDDLDGLDLRMWRLAFNGAEAVSPDTVRRFTERFAACGLAPTAMAPVYGLAEASVGLLFPPLGRVAPVDAIDRDTFARERRAVPARPGDATALRFVACGRPLPGHEVRAVDADGREVGERVEGRLEFRGPSATRGYWRNPEQTARLFDDGWLDSGDRAYRADGDIYLTGRVKDIVIRGGRNLYPQEVEEAVGAVDGVRKGCVAVFGSADAPARRIRALGGRPRGAPKARQPPSPRPCAARRGRCRSRRQRRRACPATARRWHLEDRRRTCSSFAWSTVVASATRPSAVAACDRGRRRGSCGAAAHHGASSGRR